MKNQIRSKAESFKAKFFGNIRRTSPLLILRLLSAIIVLSPWLAFSLFMSWLKMNHWRKPKVCRDFVERHKLAFEGVDPATLTVEARSGGVSNSNEIWHCRKISGEETGYFVKIFVSVGSFWAKHLSLVSPFPPIYGGRTHERFIIDMVSRVQLAECGIPVPKLIVYDAVAKVMVTDFLRGETVDDALKRIAGKEVVDPDDVDIIRQCGIGLAKVHRAGFSLIDTQPANCIWVKAEKKVYFTDLEFCTRQDKRVWDVGFFLCFLALRLTGSVKKLIQEIFLQNYQIERQLNLTEVAEIQHQMREYLPIFQTVLDLRQYTPEELLTELVSG